MSEQTKLSLSVGALEVSATFNYTDTTIDELFCAFKGLLLAHTFTESQIKNYIKELNEE